MSGVRKVWMTDELVDALRQMLLADMREWSEDNYAAGWLVDLERRLHKEGGRFELVGRLIGWPVGADAQDGWETWDEAAARYLREPRWHERIAP